MCSYGFNESVCYHLNFFKKKSWKLIYVSKYENFSKRVAEKAFLGWPIVKETLKVRESTYWSVKPWKCQGLLPIHLGSQERIGWNHALESTTHILFQRRLFRTQSNTYDGAYLQIYLTAVSCLGSKHASVLVLCNRESKR